MLRTKSTFISVSLATCHSFKIQLCSAYHVFLYKVQLSFDHLNSTGSFRMPRNCLGSLPSWKTLILSNVLPWSAKQFEIRPKIPSMYQYFDDAFEMFDGVSFPVQKFWKPTDECRDHYFSASTYLVTRTVRIWKYKVWSDLLWSNIARTILHEKIYPLVIEWVILFYVSIKYTVCYIFPAYQYYFINLWKYHFFW